MEDDMLARDETSYIFIHDMKRDFEKINCHLPGQSTILRICHDVIDLVIVNNYSCPIMIRQLSFARE